MNHGTNGKIRNGIDVGGVCSRCAGTGADSRGDSIHGLLLGEGRPVEGNGNGRQAVPASGGWAGDNSRVKVTASGVVPLLEKGRWTGLSV